MEIEEPLAKSSFSDTPIFLGDHLQDVARYAETIAKAYRVHWERLIGPELAEYVARALFLAALTHDVGKVAEGFQRSLRERRYRWEFRHEVLSAALLLSGVSDRTLQELATSAVLTHHRGFQDEELCNDIGVVPLPLPGILQKVWERFMEKALELTWGWQWLLAFFARFPELRALRLPEAPQNLVLPGSFVMRLKQRLEGDIDIFANPDTLSMVLVRGWLMASDHAVSAGIKDFRTDIPLPSFPSLRSFQERLANHLGHALLEAPTGSGKTLAALLWALRNRQSGERIFYLLPYQASIEAMADVLEGIFGHENVAVLHARALDYAFREHFEELGEYTVAESRARSERELDRLAHKPIKVATPFQLLKWFFGIPRWEIGVSEMVGGLFIFDEIHAYDAHVIALIVTMVQVLRHLGGRFLFMSATFPPFLKHTLQRALGEPLRTLTIEPEDDWSRACLYGVRHRLCLHDTTLEGLLPEIIQAIHNGQRVLVVANWVTQAQELYRVLREHCPGVYLLHGRFARRDRVRKEKDVLHSLKKRDGRVCALVATQVVEVSLDVSFDTIFTEVAPVDDMLQRFGRVNRYGEHPEGVDVHVALRFDRDRLKYIYDLERIEATIAHAPRGGSALSVPVTTQWVYDVYREGWTSREYRRFEQAQKSFHALLKELRPFSHLDEGRGEFEELFQGVDILPAALFQEFDAYWRQKHYLHAVQLLVPIPTGVFHVLKAAHCLDRLRSGVLLANVRYDEDLGLTPRMVDIDASFIV